jgi:hypothetical protein
VVGCVSGWLGGGEMEKYKCPDPNDDQKVTSEI